MVWTLIPYGRQLLLQRLGDRFQRMLGRDVDAPVGGGEQAAHGRGEDDLALLAFARPTAHDALGEHERQEDVDLVVLADEVDRDLPDRAGLAHAGIVPQHVDIPGLRLGDVIRVGQIETLDAEDSSGPAPWLPRAAA